MIRPRTDEPAGSGATLVVAPVAPEAPRSTTRGLIARLGGDAAAMTVSSALTAVVGALFWVIAAAVSPLEDLGVETAVLALVMSAGTVAGAGVGDAMAALLPQSGSPGTVLGHAVRQVLLLGAVIGAAVALAAGWLVATSRSGPGAGSAAAAALTAFLATPAVAVYTALDNVLLALGRARTVPVKNALGAVLRVAALVVLIRAGTTLPLTGSVLVASLVLSLAMVRPVRAALRRGRGPVGPADPRLLRDLDGRDVWSATRRMVGLAALGIGVATVLPFVVTVSAGARDGAVFALALVLVGMLDLVTAAIGVSLVVHARDDAGRDAGDDGTAFRFGVQLTVLVAAGAVALVLVGPLLLRAVNPALDLGSVMPVIALLALGSVGRVPFVVWSAVLRHRLALRPVIRLNAAVALTALPFVALGGRLWGALGASAVLMAAQLVLGAGAARSAHAAGWSRPRPAPESVPLPAAPPARGPSSLAHRVVSAQPAERPAGTSTPLETA